MSFTRSDESDADFAVRDRVDRRQGRAAVFEHPFERLCEPRHIEGLHDKALTSRVSCLDFIRAKCAGAHRDHNDVFRAWVGLQLASRLPPINIPHSQIHEDEGGHMFPRERETLGSVASGKDSKGAAAGQIRGQCFSAIGVIINDEDSRLIGVQESSIDLRGWCRLARSSSRSPN